MATNRTQAANEPIPTDQRIMQEAERLFRTIGYAKTTVADIARACDMSPSNVYRFFKSKSAINEAICRVHLAEVEALARAIVESDRPAAGRLRDFVTAVHRTTCERYFAETRLHDMVAAAIQEHWAVILQHKDRMQQLIRIVIEDGVRRGEFAVTDSDRVASLVHAALMKFCHPLAVVEHMNEDLAAQAEAMADFLAGALRSGAA